MTTAANDSGNIELFLVTNNQNVATNEGPLIHMVRENKTGDWEESTIELPDVGPKHVESYISYSTDFILRDAKGALMPNAAVRLRAASETEVTVNGRTYFIDSNTPANLVANGAGILSMTQQTSSLGVPTLEIELVGAMHNDENHATRQFEGVRDFLKKAKTDDYKNATYKVIKDNKYTGEDKPLLPQAYRDDPVKMIDPLQKAMVRLMELGDSPSIRLDASGMSRQAQKLGVGRCPQGLTKHLNRLSARDEMTPWRLSFRDGVPVFEELSAEDMEDHLVDTRSRCIDVGRIPFFSDIYDLVAGIAEGVYQLATAAFKIVTNGVKATIEFVYNQISYVFDFICGVFEKVFGVAEAIFESVQAGFEEVFGWIGYVFDWNDILRSRTAISYTVTTVLDFVKKAVGGIQNKLDDQIESAQQQVPPAFEKLAKLIGANGTLGGYAKANQPVNKESTALSAAAANNIVLNSTINSRGSVSYADLLVGEAAEDGDAGDGLLGILNELGETFDNNQSFKDAISFLKDLGSSPDQIFDKLLSALLKSLQGMVEVALTFAKKLLDELLKLMDALVDAVKVFITTPRDNIPFVSDLYRWLTTTDSKPNGDPLTLLDLGSLIAAIPMTVLYKAISKLIWGVSSAPFPDEASLEAFKSSFSKETLLARSGLDPNSAMLVDAGLAVSLTTLQGTELALGITVAVCNLGFGFLTSVLDVLPSDLPWQVNFPLTACAFMLESAIVGCSCPWITSQKPWDCNTSNGASMYLWILGIVGWLLDGVFIFASLIPKFKFKRPFRFPEHTRELAGVIASSVYGLAHVLTAVIIQGTYQQQPALSTFEEIIEGFSEGTTLLQWEAIVKIEPKVLVVGAAINFVCAVASTACSITNTVTSLKSSSEDDNAIIYIPARCAWPSDTRSAASKIRLRGAAARDRPSHFGLGHPRRWFTPGHPRTRRRQRLCHRKVALIPAPKLVSVQFVWLKTN